MNQGVRGRVLMKKTRGKISRVSVPLSEKSCDNRNKHIQQEAIILFRKKLKTPFCINPIPSVHIMVWFGLSAFLTIPVCYYQRP